MTNGSAVASRLQFEYFQRVVDAETRKIQVRQNLPGWFFLSLTVSDYYINTISNSFGRSKRPISGFRHSGRHEAPTSGPNLGLKISPIKSP